MTQDFIQEEQSKIAQFYEGKSVLVTGALGFLGGVLVEKLLRCCPGIDKLYLLLRPNKGKSIQERLQQFLNTELFEKLKQNSPDFARKIVPVQGDCCNPGLGLEEDSRNLIVDNVSVVFHSAATVSFNEKIRTAFQCNVQGTKELLNICLEMRKLEAYVHVSTAFSHCQKGEIEEKVYPMETSLLEAEKMLATMTDDEIEKALPRLLEGRPNTYTWTKAMAENLLKSYSDRLPVAIFRPSIVTGTCNEPFPGWVNNLNGPTGVMTAAYTGLARALHVDGAKRSDLVPVDLCINCIISIAWQLSMERTKEMKIYNFTSGTLNPVTWSQVHKISYNYVLRNPFVNTFWVPSERLLIPNDFLYNLVFICLQLFPAYLLDLFGGLFGKKRRMVLLQQKIGSANSSLQFFTKRDWDFCCGNVEGLLTEQDDADRRHFDCDIKKIIWDTYVPTYMSGMQRFIMKESPKNMSKARQYMNRLLLLEKAGKIMFASFIFFTVISGGLREILFAWMFNKSWLTRL